MPLLNYTTEISADKTVMQIQQMLARAGASAILLDYNQNGNIIALSFKMPLNDSEISFKLPCNPKPVQAVLERQRVERRYRSEEQALRVAWRIVKDWVEAQLAIIETQMVTTAQVFLPYAVTSSGQSLYEYIGQNTNLLLSKGES